jgi:hypothetical protein
MIIASMPDLVINILSAVAVSGIITAMAGVQSQKLKAILYTLPFPITIALIGSSSVATSLTMLGLMLTGCFLWGCYYLHLKRGMNALYADALLAVVYVIAAYLLAQSVHTSFWAMFTVFVAGWLLLMILFRKITFSYRSQTPSKTNLWLKAVVVFVIAFGLFSTHQYLAAFVVTFPYNGVFAVYENRAGLLPQAALFTRNSLALGAYFLANYLVGTQLAAPVRYAASWLAFGAVLILVNKYIKVHIQDVKTPAVA